MSGVSVDRGVSYPKHTLWYKLVINTLRPIGLPIVKHFIGLKTQKRKLKFEKPMFVFYNHVSDVDFFVALDLYHPYSRFIISDAMFRKRFNRIVFPIFTNFIYRRKGENADSVVESVNATLKEGISMCISAEGGETTNGGTAPIRQRTGKMVKDAKVGFVCTRYYGGYFIKPTWANNKAKGPGFAEIMDPHPWDEIKDMTPEEINDLIAKDIHVNNYEWNREKRIPYDRENRAECMERTLFICPKCHSMCDLHSHGDVLECDCGYSVSVDECGFFVGDELYFDNLYDWDIWQKEYLGTLLPEWKKDPQKPIASNEGFSVEVLENNMPKILDENVSVMMNCERMTIKGENIDLDMPLEEISGIAITVRDGVGISYGGEHYVIRSKIPECVGRYRFIRKVVLGQKVM